MYLGLGGNDHNFLFLQEMRVAFRALSTRISRQGTTVIAPRCDIRLSKVSQPHLKALRTCAVSSLPSTQEFSQRDLQNSCHPHSAEKVEDHKHNTSDGDSTIFALSTPTGRSAIAVVRVSGPACLDVCTL